ncbi:MAG: plastocyanin/azurin family copper-binding protein [Gemmatimonadales bacterium]
MHHRKHTRAIFASLTLAVAFIVSGCSTEKKAENENEAAEHAAEPAASGPGTVAATGDTILIEAWTDAAGNYFKPNKIEAHRGDVLRYVLKVGVHNVHFLPDSNTVKTGLPPASEMLQLPGQTYDLVVSMQPGDYYFQCDPHAALGMKGRLEVESKD